MGVEVPTVRKSISSPRPRAGRLGGVWASVPGGGLTRAPPPAIWMWATSASSAAGIGLDCTQTEAARHPMQEPRRRRLSMEIAFLRALSAWEQFARPWNDLLARSATDVPFLRFEFLRAWWTTLGGGEWPDGELWVAVGRGQDGGLGGGAPPVSPPSARPGALLLIGTVEIADYLDIVAPAPSVEPFAQAILDALPRPGPPGGET